MIAIDAVKSAVASYTSGFTARLRRDAILAGICAVCAIAALVLLASAAVVALEPAVGAAWARLIVGLVFALFGAVAAWRLTRKPAPAGDARLQAQAGHSQSSSQAHNQANDRRAQFAQLAMIVEAVMLGYSMSRRSNRR